jgi:nucleoside 2-deoxyribosyltransferase
MGYLKGQPAYLSGPIEFDKTSLNWRTEPMKVLTKRFGIKMFDPHQDPKQQWVPALLEARKKSDITEMARIAKNFVRKDLSMVDGSRFLIACLPKGVSTCGTHHEIFIANTAKKPTLLICPDGLTELPLWYYGFIKPDFLFGSWDDLYEYLQEVDDGKHKHNDRWWMTYCMI